jgi:hypothetical protein
MLQKINHARERGLWLYCNYQNLWFSPDELECHVNNGRFVWGDSWIPRNPEEYLIELEEAVVVAKKNVINFKARMNNV